MIHDTNEVDVELDAGEFRAREELIARAGLDEDWLASLGLAIVPVEEVELEVHRVALHEFRSSTK